MDRRLTIAVIPARHHATRFPGKPLTLIAGIPMVVRVARAVAKAEQIDRVAVATDSPAVAEVVEGAGFGAVMTGRGCRTGTDRVAEAALQLDAPESALVVNVQGDEPLIDPDDLDLLVAHAARRPDAISTLVRHLQPDEVDDPHTVKVAMTAEGRALYFSRAPIPYSAPAHAHVGVYAYRLSVLRRFVAADPTALEGTEKLEQLRALEMGIPIYVATCRSERPSIGVDVPEDVARVEAALRAHGPN